VRVVLADDIANHAGRFLEGRARVKPQLAHSEEKPAVNRLEAIAKIRESPVHDRRERIGEVTLFQRFAEIDRLNGAASGRNQCFSHGSGLSPGVSAIQARAGSPPERLTRAIRLARASGGAMPRGSKTWRARKYPVRSKP
jgi:hypothetical protein